MSVRRSLQPVVATLLLVALVACGGDDPAGLNVTAGPLSARIDGVVYTAVSAFAVNSGGIVGVGASNLSGEGLGFAFQGSTTGTYTIGPSIPTTANITFGSDVWSAGPGTGSGSVVVTTLTTTRVAGTFAFEVVSTTGTPAMRSITEGTFDITY